MGSIINSLLPVFLMILLGAGLTRFNIVARDAWSGVERLTYYVLFPALIVSMLAKADLSGFLVVRVASVQVSGVIVMTLLCLALYPLLRRNGINGASFTSIYQGAARWNSTAALAICGSLYGAEGTLIVAMALAIMTPFTNIVTVAVMARFTSATPVGLATYVQVLARNPLIWSCLVGGFINVAAVPLPDFITVSLDMLGKAAISIGLVMVGGGLDLARARQIDLPIVVSSVLRLAVMPVLIGVMGRLAGIEGAAFAALMICAGVPTASASYVLAKQMGGDAPLMARITTIQTLLAFATLPIVIILAN